MTVLNTADLADFARARDLDFVALFGSRARGSEQPGSDHDVALMPARGDAIESAIEAGVELSRILGRGDIDTTWLPTASWLLCARVARDGRVLYQRRPGAFRAFQIAALLEAADSDVWRRRQSTGIRRSITHDRTMDSDLVRQRLALLTDVIRELRAVLDVPRESGATELMRRWAVERSLLLLIEYAAEINSEAATCAGIPPSDYYSSFFSASRAGWFGHELASSLASLVPLRNQLVHAYPNVPPESIVDRIVGTLPAWDRYVAASLDRLADDE